MTISEIAKAINKSQKVIHNLLKDLLKKDYRKKKNGGRPAALSNRDKRAILRAALNSYNATKEIVRKVGVNTNIKNVCCVLQAVII